MNEFEAFLGVNFWDALFALANFLLLYVVLRKFLFRPVMKLIEDRQKEIDDLYAAADTAKSEAAAIEAEYRSKLSRAQETGEQIVKEAVTRGQNREEEILRKANQEADAIRKKAAQDIAREKKKAVIEAKDEISDMALAIAGKVVGRALTDQDQTRLIDQFIDELGDEA